jgi:hypothetical protein
MMRKYTEQQINFSKLYHDCKSDNHSHQLSLPLESTHQKREIFRQKAQIKSSPGVSAKQRDRYRVMVGTRVLGDFLNIDEALLLANQSTHL